MDAYDRRLAEIEARELASLGWKAQPIGLGVSRCPADPDGNGLPLRCNMGYVPPREAGREKSWRASS